MSLNHSPLIVTDGLILALDAANRKSYIGAAPASLINTNSWTVSSGSVDGYGQNGNTNENARLYDTDPWGNQSIVWGTYASGDGQADGGWNTNYPSIDPTKLYRFSVWVRRISSTGAGTFYFGTGAGGGEVRGTSDSATKGNPYWECVGTSALTQNQWYLVCGHVYPHFSTYTGRHPNTGYFTIAGGTNKVMDVNGCNIGNDLKWDSASNSATHRTYHYYCSDATTRLQFFSPRIDMCDGNEPSISELLTNGNSVWRDLSSDARICVLNNPSPAPYTSLNGGGLIFDGNSNKVTINTNTLISGTSPYTIDVAFKTSANSVDYIFGNYGSANSGGLEYYVYQSKLNNYIAGNTQSATVLNVNQWYIASVTRSGSTITHYLNGVADGSGTNAASISATNPFTIGNGHDYTSEAFGGTIGAIKVYNRALSAEEVKQNFNALRGRYGI